MENNSGGYSSSRNNFEDTMSIPLHFSKPHSSKNQNNKRSFKVNDCEGERSGNSQIDTDYHLTHYNSEFGDKDIEKENIPLQKLSNLHCDNYHDMDTRETLKYLKNSNFKSNLHSKKIMNHNRQNLPPETSNYANKQSLKQNRVKETNCNDLEDQELIDIFCNSNHKQKSKSTLLLKSSSGRSNPAIPTDDIVHYPPSFDIFNDARVVFRPI